MIAFQILLLLPSLENSWNEKLVLLLCDMTDKRKKGKRKNGDFFLGENFGRACRHGFFLLSMGIIFCSALPRNLFS